MPRQPITFSSANPWDVVSNGIRDILMCKQSALSLSKLHSAVFTLISNSQISVLESGLFNMLMEHFRVWKEELSKRAGDVLLLYFSSIIESFKNYCVVIPKVYMQFDNNNAIGSQSVDLVHIAFVRCILKNENQFISDLFDEINKVIYALRTGQNARIDVVTNIIDMFCLFDSRIEIYKKIFDILRDETNKFYSDFFNSKFEGCPFSEYLMMVSKQLDKEESILKNLFMKKPDQIEVFLKIAFNQLFGLKEEKITSRKWILDTIILVPESLSQIKWLTTKFTKYGLSIHMIYKSIANGFYNEIANLSSNFNENLKSKEIAGFVKEVIDLINRLSSLYENVFKDMKKAFRYGKEMFKKAWNIEKFNIPVNFCIFIDLMIKNQLKDFPEEEKKTFPQLVAKFYKMITDKQLFQTSYEIYMQQRFFKLRGKAYELEKAIVLEIRRAGIQIFAKNLDLFKKQIHNTELLMDEFNTSLKNTDKNRIKFEPIVFDDNIITLNKKPPGFIPESIGQIHQEFSSFFSNKFEHFKISLLGTYSMVESKLKITKGNQTKIFTITSDIICAAILHQISTGPKKYKELVSTIGNNNIIHHLKRVCSKTCPILRRNTSQKEVSDNDVFSFNPKIFTSKSRVIVIQPIKNERKLNSKTINSSSNEYKSNAIECAAVRILKQKLQLTQKQLENDIVDALAQYFSVEPLMMEMSLLKLQNNGYLERQSQENGDVIVKYIS